MVAAMVEIRPCRDEADEARSLEIYNTVWPRDAVGMDELNGFKAQLVAWCDEVAWSGERAVGSAFTAIRPERRDLPFVFLTVLPEARRRGAGTALYRSASDWVARHGLDRLEAVVEEDDEESLGFADRRGFVEQERNQRVVLDLAQVQPLPVEAPDGIEVVTLAERPDLERDVYAIYVEAVPDIPGQEDDEVSTLEDWRRHHMSGRGDPPEGVFVAVADGRGVGYAKFSLNSALPGVAFHDLTGVLRAWRGRGIAGALKRAQIVWAKERGFAELVTQNELRNAPIRRLNERLGYRRVPGRVFLVGPLAPEPEHDPVD
jgi:GNAT superfamily N-acetyltransferase